MLAGCDLLPALSTAMTVNMFSPPRFAYKVVPSPVVRAEQLAFGIE
jgi:hypothetical protein